MVHGVVRLTLTVVPPIFNKGEVKNKGLLWYVSHTVK